MVAAFFGIEIILLFSQAPFYSFYSNFLKEIGYSTTQIGTLWATGVIAEIVMFAVAQKVFFIRFSWRTLVAACLKTVGLVKFSVANTFEPVVKPFLLQCMKPCACFTAECDLSKTVCVIASPLTVIPGAETNIIAVKTVFLFHVAVHELRPVDVFLVIIAAYMQHRYLRPVHITQW